MRIAFKMVFGVLILAISCQTREQLNTSMVIETKTAVDSVTGLVIDKNFELIRGQCTACHSAKLITQNNASREGWEQMIRWMQRDQGLWDLGANEALILDYLALHYGPKKKGRRTPLTNIDWYYLQE